MWEFSVKNVSSTNRRDLTPWTRVFLVKYRLNLLVVNGRAKSGTGTILPEGTCTWSLIWTPKQFMWASIKSWWASLKLQILKYAICKLWVLVVVGLMNIYEVMITIFSLQQECAECLKPVDEKQKSIQCNQKLFVPFISLCSCNQLKRLGFLNTLLGYRMGSTTQNRILCYAEGIT